jgi:exonuclease VII small subunit
MPSSVLLPLIVFFALALPICLLLWRVFWVGGELRRDAAHGRAALDIARRVDMSLAELAELVDELRRRKANPDASGENLRAASEALRIYAREAEQVDKYAIHAAGSPTFVSEIERAQRAVDLIEHGRGLMLEPAEEKFAEGETSVKRGYLNLMHARDAIKARAREIADAALRPPVPGAKSARPRGRNG